MESEYSKDNTIVHETLKQIRYAIEQLQEWNEGVVDIRDWAHSANGMQRLAANGMMIQVIGERLINIPAEKFLLNVLRFLGEK